MSYQAVEFNETQYHGTTAGCTLFVGLYHAFEQEFGKERAMPVLTGHGEALGRYYGQMLRNALNGRTPTIGEMAEHIRAFAAVGFGCKMSYEEQPDGLKVRYENCPIAGALAELGYAPDGGRQFCMAFGAPMYEALCKEVGWSYKFREYRHDWGGACEEMFLAP